MNQSLISFGSHHCCVCAGVCHHIPPVQLCDMHKAESEAVKPLIDQRRSPEFMDRLARRAEEDAPILARIGDRPCPAKVIAVLGFPEPTELPCGLLEFHRGDHTYTITWAPDHKER